MLNFDQPKLLRDEADSQEDNRLLNKQQVSDEKYSSMLKERPGSLIWNFSGRLYWAIPGRLCWG